jgi:hypothetical protein
VLPESLLVLAGGKAKRLFFALLFSACDLVSGRTTNFFTQKMPCCTKF